MQSKHNKNIKQRNKIIARNAMKEKKQMAEKDNGVADRCKEIIYFK